jgi:CheY-like chemotaxis protein
MSVPASLLHVEEVLSLRLLVSKVLNSVGVKVTSCASTAEAERQGTGFEVALIDNHFPDGLGVRLATSLREKNPDLMLLCTALPSSRPPHGVFDGYLAKPFQLHQLFQTLDEAMDQRRYDQTRRALQERLREARKRSAL